MSDVDDLIGSVTEGEASDDAAASLISPDALARLRASGSGRRPPNATRPAEPESDGTDEEEERPRASARGKYARYRKDELLSEVERLAQRVEELSAQLVDKEESRKTDPDAVRDLAMTIQLLSSFGFGVMGSLRGPHWNTTKEQNAQIGASGAIALAPYAAEWDWMPMAQFAIILGGTIGQKVAEDRRISKLQEVPPDDQTHT